MLVRLERAVDLGGGTARRLVELRSSTLRLQLIEASCGAFDTTKLRGRSGSRLSLFTVPLRGTYVTHHGHREASAAAGQAVFEARGEWTERWCGPRQTFVVAYWPHARGRGASTELGAISLGPAEARGWQEVAESLRGPSSAEAYGAAVVRVQGLMRAHGVEPPAVELAPPAPLLGRLVSALNASLTRMHEAPAWQDLSRHAGLSDRQLRRAWERHATYLPAESFRDALKQARVISARHLLEGAKAPVGAVARALGYGSTRALRAALDG